MTDFRILSDVDKCTGCNACVSICPKSAITIKETALHIRTIIDTHKCIECHLCRQVCQNYTELIYKTPIKIFQGWNNNLKDRLHSASGGFISAVVSYFLDNDASVYGCVFETGIFTFRKVKDKEDFINFAGSKYVKSHMGKVYYDIKAELSSDRCVLFIGLPCQVQGLKSYLSGKYETNLYTIDLICHGTPSHSLYIKHLCEEGYNPTVISNISFRNKNRYFPLTNHKFDYWLVPFLAGLTYTENCYNCKFARLERVADFTAGDSWGTELSEDEVSKGVSLVLCNTNKSVELLDRINFTKKDVNVDIAIERNGQLSHSTVKPKTRERFVSLINKGTSYRFSIFRCFPKRIIREYIGSLPGVRRFKKVVTASISFSEKID